MTTDTPNDLVKRLRALLEGLECEEIDRLVNERPEILRAVGAEIAKAARLGAQKERWNVLAQRWESLAAAPNAAPQPHYDATCPCGKYVFGIPSAVAAPSDTPRTDAKVGYLGHDETWIGDTVPADFARTLERDQRRIALDVIEALAHVCEKNVDHIAENSKALRQWDDCADEARARELGSMYVREFAWLLRSGIINVDEIIGRGK